MTMELPTIHLNGTSAESLLEGYCDATDALLTAIKAMEACAPNARDYYVNDGDFSKARREHSARIEQLVAVRREINDLAEHVA